MASAPAASTSVAAPIALATPFSASRPLIPLVAASMAAAAPAGAILPSPCLSDVTAQSASGSYNAAAPPLPYGAVAPPGLAHLPHAYGGPATYYTAPAAATAALVPWGHMHQPTTQHQMHQMHQAAASYGAQHQLPSSHDVQPQPATGFYGAAAATSWLPSSVLQPSYGPSAPLAYTYPTTSVTVSSSYRVSYGGPSTELVASSVLPSGPSPGFYAPSPSSDHGVPNAPFYFAHLIPVKLTMDNYLSWRAQVLPLLHSRYLCWET